MAPHDTLSFAVRGTACPEAGSITAGTPSVVKEFQASSCMCFDQK